MSAYYFRCYNYYWFVEVFSCWGKLVLGTTVTHLIVEFEIAKLLFTGFAKAINSRLNIGDVVIPGSGSE